MKYHAIENPTLLTLVNPGKPKKAKAGGSKVTKKRKKAVRRKAKRNPEKKKVSQATLDALAKGRATRSANLAKAKRAKRAKVTKKTPPKRRAQGGTRPSKAKLTNRKARSKAAKTAGIEWAGWYPRDAVHEKAEWVWVGNKGKKRRVKKRKVAASKRRKSTSRKATSRKRLKNGRFSKRAGRKSTASKRRKTTKRRSYRRNMGLVPTLKTMVLPFLAGGAGFFAGRVAGNQIMQLEAVPASVRPYAPAISNLAVALAAFYLPKKVAALKPLDKYSEAAMVGALVSLAETLLTQFAPPNVQAYVAPPVGLLAEDLAGYGMGSNLDVYERALSGGMAGALAADDGIGEYIQEPGVGEYIEEPGMGEYIETPGMGLDIGIDNGLADFDVSVDNGLAEYIEEPGMGLEVEEAVAGFDITADEGLADEGGSLYGNETHGGVLGDKAAQGNEVIHAAIADAANAAAATGANAKQAAIHAYREVKNRMGMVKGTPQLRAAVLSAVNQAFNGAPAGGVTVMPNQPGDYPRSAGNWPVDGAPGYVKPITGKYGSPASTGILAGSVFSG